MRQADAPAVLPPSSDVVVAAALGVAGLAEVWLLADVDRVTATVGVVVMASALAWRRRRPLPACITVAWTEWLIARLSVPIDSLVFVLPVFVLALYSLGSYAPLRRSVVGAAVVLLAVALSVFANEGPGADSLGFAVVMVGAPWLCGRLVRNRTDQAATLARHAEHLERTQAERERAAVEAERARIARELHDIIAHSVSVMTIQAGAIEEVLDDDPDKARAAARSIRHTGREALSDLRRLLGLLREPSPDAQALNPPPGLAELESLVDHVRCAGLEVRLTVEGDRRALPPAVDLSAFRVVQEALTNTLKHARASSVVVALRYTADALAIEVVDDGVGPDGAGGGHGLLGMRERIALYEGRLEYGRPSSGGFRVHATLPILSDAE